MSEINDNILMWTHYAEQHKGVCLVFVAETRNGFFKDTIKVSYSKSNSIQKAKIIKSNRDDINEYKDIRDMFITKSEHWKYEAERRLINEPKKLETGKTRLGHGLKKFPGTLLTEIILGCEIESDSITFLKETLKKRPVPKIKISQAMKKEKHYGLDIIDITEQFYS